MALPLPLYACWARVVLTASHLHHWDVAKRAAAVLLPRFITTTPSRPLWQAHPMDRHRLQLQQVQEASPTLLRLLVQAVYVYAQHMGMQQQLPLLQPLAAGAAGEATGAGGLAGTAASRALLLQLSQSQVPQQVAVLESSKKLLGAMQAAAVIGDEMLVEEGALRAYNLLAPLLQQQDISPLLHQALSTLHLTLAEVKDTAQGSLEGHTQQRMAAARASAAVSHWLMRLSAPISPVLAAGAVAGSAGVMSNKQLQPAGTFARLEHALLTALSCQAPAESAAAGEPASRCTGQIVTGTAPPPAARPPKGASKQAKAEAEAAAVATAAAAAADPEVSPDEAAAAAEQLVEMTAAHDLVLLHPDGAAWASPGSSARCDKPSQQLPTCAFMILHIAELASGGLDQLRQCMIAQPISCAKYLVCLLAACLQDA
ncbi:hypothetical protein COO60DRAFT_303334 [Scenedesmus sp. NREL 46B-D3]|nr:hypothetical protein COO60DRAFT_303334 [Scenedesmus sp. NREL 46B-D3]